MLKQKLNYEQDLNKINKILLSLNGLNNRTFLKKKEKKKKVPASVDSDRQDVVVETLCGQTAHLRVRGDLSALQTLQAEHGE